ncbi:MAG: hypothetical protein FGM33_00325 [Candidatus Kapabacteria bacterium]|nr:hypothetical protein [Candidatus Kapabacteria bacterium]
MTHRILWLPILACALLISCSPEEPLINSFDDSWRLLVSNQRGEVLSFPVPNEGQSTVVWSDPSDSSRNTLERFRDRVYLLHGQRPWIVVFDADTVRAIDTIDLGSAPVTSIAFANATTAFATVPTLRSLLVIDLTVNTVARSIPMPSRPMHVAVNGNQLCVTLPDTNAVAIVDTRSLDVEKVVATAPVPWFVAPDPNSAFFCIVGLGSGKVDANTPSAASVQFLDASTRNISSPLEITPRSGPASQVIPTGLVVSSTQVAFIPTQVGMFRISTRTRNRVSTTLTEKFSAITFNDARAELIGQVSTAQGAILVYNGSADALLHRLPVTSAATSMVGIVR